MPAEKKLYECLLKIYEADVTERGISQLWEKEGIKEYAAGEICSKEACNTACEELVMKISGHEFGEISIDDFMYMKRQIVRELEEIHKKAEMRKHKIHYRMETGRSEDDIKMLYRVRLKQAEIDNGRRSILDLMEGSQE